MDPSSSGQQQEGESEGDMTAGKSGHCHSYHLRRTCVLDTMLCTRVVGQSNGKWSEESR